MVTEVNENTSEKDFDKFIDDAFVAMCNARNKAKHTVTYDDEKQELIFHYVDGTADRVCISTIEDYKPTKIFTKIGDSLVNMEKYSKTEKEFYTGE